MSPSKRGNQGRQLIAILVQTVEIGIILLLVAAVFLLWQRLQQATQQTAAVQATVDFLQAEQVKLLTQVAVTPIAAATLTTETTPDGTADANVVPFSDPNNPAALDPKFGWQPGSAANNAYDLTLEPGTLTLTAGPETDQWQFTNTGPFVVLPISGDFAVSVKVKTSLFEIYQRAGIGLRSTQDMNSWVNISRNYHSGITGAQGIMVLADRSGSSSLLNQVPYTGETCFLRIERHGPEVDLSYSEDGTNWNVLQENYVGNVADPLEIFFMASSTSKQGISAQFSELTLSTQP